MFMGISCKINFLVSCPRAPSIKKKKKKKSGTEVGVFPYINLIFASLGLVAICSSEFA